MSSRRQRSGLLLILLGHVVLALLYAWTIPPWEAPDEPAHVRRVGSLACAWGWGDPAACAGEKVLGRQAVWQLQPAAPGETPAPCPTGRNGDQGSARPAVWDRDFLLQSYEEYQPRLGHLVWVPWFVFTGPAHPPVFVDPDYPGEGPGVFVHDLDLDPAVAPSVRSLRALRSFGALLGMLTVLGVWRCGRLLAPQKPGVALAASAIAAFLPQFTFLAGYVNNDLPAAAAGVWLTALVLHRLAPGRRVSPGWLAGTVLLLLAAGASRPNAAGLLLLVLLTLLALVGRQHGWKRSLTLGLGFALAALAMLRALRLFWPAFWLTWSGHFEGRLLGHHTLTPLEGFLGVSRSLVGVFGWMDVPLPPLAYAAAGTLTLVLVGSLVVQLRRASQPWFRTVVGILVAGFLGVAVPTFLNALSRGQAQGRYLLPALGILAVLAGLGACGACAAGKGWRLAAVLAVLLFAGDLAALRGTLIPAYPAADKVRLTRLETPQGPLLIQHDPLDGGPGFPADRKGRWVLAAPAQQPLSLRLSLHWFRNSEQALLADALAAGRLEDPAALPGVAGVTSHGPGDSPAARVQPLAITVGQVQRRALLAHPTSRIVLDPVRIAAGARVRVVLGMDDRVRDKVGDGVTFRFLVLLERGEKLLLERHLDPRVRSGDGIWLTEEVDSAALAGRQGSFVLETLAGPAGDTSYDWSAWAAVDLQVPRQPIAMRLCRSEEGAPLEPGHVALDLPAGGNVTLRLLEPAPAGTDTRLLVVPQARDAGH